MKNMNFFINKKINKFYFLLENLPIEIIFYILEFFNKKEILSFRLISKNNFLSNCCKSKNYKKFKNKN